MKYRPRRSSKRWLEKAPEYVLAVYDTGENRFIDRYTVMFGGSLWHESMGRSVQYLALNDCPTSPNMGFSQWGEMPAYNRNIGKHIRWLDLPENVRQHVIMRATE